MAMLEQAAVERGATVVYLDTFSFQAPEFYRRCGYAVALRIDGFRTDRQAPDGQASRRRAGRLMEGAKPDAGAFDAATARLLPGAERTLAEQLARGCGCASTSTP